MNPYMFSHVTASNWVTIILIIWGIAVVWSAVICLVTRIRRKKYADKDVSVPGICTAGCTILGIISGVCALNLVMNALNFDAGFVTILVLFIAAGIVGGTSYGVGWFIITR